MHGLNEALGVTAEQEQVRHNSGRPKHDGEQFYGSLSRKEIAALDALFFSVLLAGIVSSGKTEQRDIQLSIDQSPFVNFWAKLNEQRARAGMAGLLYEEACTLFTGGETPVGAMTFIGKQWDGLRAVPAEPVKFLGGSRPAYHGEYRIVSDAGTVWHKVKKNHEPVVYKIPEAAITAAEEVRNFRRGPHGHGMKSS
jgi:hypothetical protein